MSRHQAHLRSMSKGRASRRAKSHHTMTQAKSRAVDRKSTMCQGDLMYNKNDPCSSHGAILDHPGATRDAQHAWPGCIMKHRSSDSGQLQNVKLEGTRVKEDRKKTFYKSATVHRCWLMVMVFASQAAVQFLHAFAAGMASHDRMPGRDLAAPGLDDGPELREEVDADPDG